MTMKDFVEKCVDGQNLTTEEASAALELIVTGQATESQIAGLLVALKAKGETIDEIVGFARTMRRHAVSVNVDDANAIDMCGTGGDGLGTVNISTIASFVAAGAGVTVAKHGNRSVSSQTGSADLLAALGVKVQVAPEKSEAAINRVGIGFLFAPTFHPAMKHAAKTRGELGFRTIFNMLGPITNPARVKKQVVGAYHTDVASNLAGALSKLDADNACVVHSSDGMDEVSLSGSTSVFEVNGDRSVRRYFVHPEDFGFTRASLAALRGGDSERNAEIAMDVLSGKPSAVRDVVVANAGLGVRVAGRAQNIREGTSLAMESIDSGRALAKLKALIEYTNRA
jgi:anthranilate phosphoribosyltransferase